MAIDAFIGTWTDKDLISRIDELPNFRSLVIYGYGVTDVGAELISRCTKLKELHLLDTQITNAGLKHIGKLKSLDWLALDNASVDSEGLRHLCGLTQLSGLHIVSTVAGDDGFSMLLNMPKLTYLEAAGENLRGGTMSIISQLPELITLRLASSKGDDRDFAQLGFARSLKQISYDMPLVTHQGIADLSSRLRDTYIEKFRYFKPENRLSYMSGYCFDLYDQRRFDLARLAVDDVIRWLPFNPAAHGTRALINFNLGLYEEFRQDLRNVRDNAELFGENELLELANQYLEAGSEAEIRKIIAESRPENLLLERLRSLEPIKTEEPISSLIKRFDKAVSTKQNDPIKENDPARLIYEFNKSLIQQAEAKLSVPTSAEAYAIMQTQQDEYKAFIEGLRKKKNEPVNVPWQW
jgi:hypothetical protein